MSPLGRISVPADGTCELRIELSLFNTLQILNEAASSAYVVDRRRSLFQQMCEFTRTCRQIERKSQGACG